MNERNESNPYKDGCKDKIKKFQNIRREIRVFLPNLMSNPSTYQTDDKCCQQTRGFTHTPYLLMIHKSHCRVA